MTTNSLDVPRLPKMPSSIYEQFSTPLAKPPAVRSDTPEPEDRPYRVSLYREVAKVVTQQGVDSDVFRPTIGEFITKIENEPKQFEKKRGKLKDARSADVRFSDGIAWRAMFVVDDDNRVVRVLALAPHHVAYEDAQRRV